MRWAPAVACGRVLAAAALASVAAAAARAGDGWDELPRRDVVVTVRDRASGAPVEGAVVLAGRHPSWVGRRAEEWSLPWPGEVAGGPLTTAADGSASVPSLPAPGSVYVRAPGRAWNRISVPADGPSEIDAPLDPGGDLRVVVASPFPLPDAIVEIDDVRAARPEGGDVLVRGVRPGLCRVTVRRGWDYQEGEVYGEARCLVVAGEVAEVELAVTSPDRGPGRPVTIRAEFAPWPDGERDPLVRGIDVPGEWSHRGEIDEWGRPEGPWTGSLPRGRYRVSYPSCLVEREFVVADAALDVVVVAPRPGTVAFAPVDARSGCPLLLAEVFLRRPGTDGFRTGRVDGTYLFGVAGRIGLPLAPGPAAATVSAPGYEPVDQAVEVEAGRHRTVRVPLRRATRIRVRATVGGGPVPPSATLRVQARLTSAIDARRVRWETEDGRTGYQDRGGPHGVGTMVLEPLIAGEWQVRVGGVPGYADSGLLRVVAEPGRTTELEVRLLPYEEADWVRVRGTVTGGEAWDERPRTVHARAGDGRQRDQWMDVGPSAEGGLPFDSWLPPGLWALTVHPVGMRFDVAVARGMTPVTLALPEPCTWVMDVRDARSGAVVPGARILRWEDVGWEIEPIGGEFPFQSAEAEHEIEADAPGYLCRRMTLHGERGATTRVRLALEPAAVVVVRLLDSGVPVRGEIDAHLYRVDEPGVGADVCCSRASDDGTLAIMARDPGRHLLRVRAPDGFERVPDREVELVRGETLRVDVELRRAR